MLISMKLVQKLRDREEGQGLVEYTFILTFISVVVVLALEAIGLEVLAALDDAVAMF